MYYPAFLNLKNRRVVLFGGGQVALRKARVLVKCGANLIVISRDFSPSFLRFARSKRTKLRYGTAIPKKLKETSLVVAATSDRAFNEKIYTQCVRQGIFVNVVDDPGHSTFIVPSVLRRGSLQIAISTGGASPFLAKLLRKKLSKQFGTGYGRLVKTLSRDRQKTKQSILVQKDRRNRFRRLAQTRLKMLEGKIQ